MGEKSKPDSRFARFMKRAFIVYSALTISNSSLEGSFINAFRVKNVMAEPVVVKEKSPKEAAADFLFILTKIMKAPASQVVQLKEDALAILDEWGSDEKFVKEFAKTGIGQIERALEGSEDGYSLVQLMIEVSHEHKIFKNLEEEVKEFSKTEIKYVDGKYHDIYIDYKRSPFYQEDKEGKFRLGDLMGYAVVIKPAETIVDKIADGRTADAKKIYDSNKHDEIFIEALAWKTFNIFEEVVTLGNKTKIENVELLLGLQDEEETALSEKFKEIFDKHTAEGGDYHELYINYKQYAEEKQLEPTLTGFMETMCDVQTSMKEGKPHLYPFSIIGPLSQLSKVKPVPITMEEAKGEAVIAKYKLEQAMTFIEKRTKDTRKMLTAISEDVERYVTEKDAKKRLNAQIKLWEEQLNEWEGMLAEAKKLKKKKKFTQKDVDFLNGLIEIAGPEAQAGSLDYFIENEILTVSEIRDVKLLSMAFVNALMTGSSESYGEFNEAYAAVMSMQEKQPKKYAFALDFIGAFLHDISPEVYSVVKTPELMEAVVDVYQNMDDVVELEKKRQLYGGAFTDYIVYNKDVFEDILLTPDEKEKEKLIEKNYKDVYTKAELLYNLPNNILEIFEEVYIAVDAGDEEKLKELKASRGAKFVDLISKNIDIFYELLLDPDATAFTLADEQPELLTNLKKNYLPLAQSTILLTDLHIVLKEAMSFRKAMQMALSETERKNAKMKVMQAFEGYQKYFGNNLGVLKLFYDVDTLLGKEVTDISQVENFFTYNILPSAFSFKEQNIYAAGVSHDIMSLYYADRAFSIANKSKFAEDWEAVQQTIMNGIRLVTQRDPYLLPSYFENVIKPMADVVDDPETFVLGLGAFNSMLSARYDPNLTQLGYLTNKTRTDFKTIFELFAEGVKSGALKDAMTHFELEEEVRVGEEPGPKEFPAPSIYMPTQPETYEPVHPWFKPGLLWGAPLDLLADPEAPETAYLPMGDIEIDSDAEGLHHKLDMQLGPLTKPMPGISMPKEANIRPLAQSRLAMFIRKIFGEIPISYSTDLIMAYGDAGAYGRGGTYFEEETGVKTTTTAGGGALEAKEKFAEGGLMELALSEVATMTVEEEEEKEEKVKAHVSESLFGGGVGPLGSISQTFKYSGVKGGQHSVRGTLDWLMGLSAPEKEVAFEFDYQEKKVVGFPWEYTWGEFSSDEVEAENPEAHTKIVEQLELLKKEKEMVVAKEEEKKVKLKPIFGPFMEGHSLLTYVPQAIYETEEGEKAIQGKVYYMSKDGDVIQLGLSEQDENMLLSYIFGSGETEHVIASLRKYDLGTWTAEGEWVNWGGAFGFTIDPMAVFMMEDAIRRVGYEYVLDEASGEMVKRVDMKKLEAVGLAAVPISLAINNAFEHGTVAFITRAAVPAEIIEEEGLPPETKLKGKAGVYTLETIINKVEPMSDGVKHDWELRVVGGYPIQAGIVWKSKKIEEMKEKTWYAKAGTASYFLWSSLLQQEQEAELVAEYVRNLLIDVYHMTEDKAKQHAYMIGASLMFAGIDETKGKLEKMGSKEFFTWDNTFFTLVGAYYASKFNVFGGVQKMPAYMRDAFEMMDDSMADMIQDPYRADQISENLSKELALLSKTTAWKGVMGMSWHPKDTTIRLLGKAEVTEPKGYGYTLIGGSLFVGSHKGVKPYGEALASTYWFTGAGTYMDIYGMLGAEALDFSPHETFEFDLGKKSENAAEMKKLLNKKTEDIMVELLTKYYRLSEELAKLRSENFEFVFAPNMSDQSDKELTHYYLLVDPGEGKGYIGNEKDKDIWMEKGLELYNDIFVLRAEDELIELETSSTKQAAWFSRIKGIGGVTLQIEPEVAEAGWTAGVLADIFSDYRKEFLMGTYAAKRELEEGFADYMKKEDWMQFTFVFSGAWDKLNWNKVHDKLYAYAFFNYVDREVHIVPPEEAPAMFEIMRATTGGGMSWSFFDFTLGETAKVEAFVEAGVQKVTTKGKVIETLGEYTPPFPLPGGETFPGGFTGGVKEKLVTAGTDTEFIMRMALSYSWKLSKTGSESWLTIQGVGYKGWWPIAEPLNITQPWTLKTQKDMYDLERLGVSPWGFMIYGSWLW